MRPLIRMAKVDVVARDLEGRKPAGLAELYVRHGPDALALAFLLTGDRALAEDLTQEASDKNPIRENCRRNRSVVRSARKLLRLAAGIIAIGLASPAHAARALVSAPRRERASAAVGRVRPGRSRGHLASPATAPRTSAGRHRPPLLRGPHGQPSVRSAPLPARNLPLARLPRRQGAPGSHPRRDAAWIAGFRTSMKSFARCCAERPRLPSSSPSISTPGFVAAGGGWHGTPRPRSWPWLFSPSPRWPA